ncbi:MAG: hypothetical protein ACOX52_04135 [Verrucomicrobiota bacterium]
MASGPHGPLTPGVSCPNPIPRSFDTDTDSDPDPDLASPLTFSNDLQLGPETYTMMRRVRVGVRVLGVADQSDHCRNRNRDRDRDQSLP